MGTSFPCVGCLWLSVEDVVASPTRGRYFIVVRRKHKELTVSFEYT